MRLLFAMTAFVILLLAAVSIGEAQPGGKKGDKGSQGAGETVDEFVAKLMAFNKAKNGKLTKEELTDKRLHALFDRADANKDGVVTRAELEVLYQKEKLGGGGPGGPGDKGKDKKGFKGKGGPSQPGVVLPAFIQDMLKLTDSQRKDVADLQKEVDAKLDKILTAEQRSQLKEMSAPKGFGPPGGEKKKGPPPEDK